MSEHRSTVEESKKHNSDEETLVAVLKSISDTADMYKLCDMCNCVIEDEDHHNACQHHELVSLVEHYKPVDSAAGSRAPPIHEMVLGFSDFITRDVDRDDGGAEAFRVILECEKQLNLLLNESMDERPLVFLFGSCVSMGCWDGRGDADFSAVVPGLIDMGEAGTAQAKHYENCIPSRTKEKEFIRGICKKMKNGGFQYEELEPVVNSRIPVVRRKRKNVQQYDLHRHSATEPYVIDYQFDNKRALDGFKHSFEMLESHYGAKLEDRGKTTRGRRAFTASMTNGSKALRLFSRKEGAGIAKEWKKGGRLPELFSIDLDISARTFGIRNSWFLRHYLEQSPVFRVGNMFIKKWSKKKGVNNSRRGFLTSYAVTSLWIYYLLHCGAATFIEPSSVPIAPRQAQQEIGYLPLWPADMRQSEAQRATLATLVSGFFHFYAFEFDWEQHVVSLRHNCHDPAQVLTKEAAGWTADKEIHTLLLADRIFYNICIDDPYEDDLNLGRHLTPAKAGYVKQQFLEAAQHCQRALSDAATATGAGAAPSSETAALRPTVPFEFLLMDCKEKAEEELRSQVYLYLVQHHGHATIASLRKALLAQNSSDLFVYELQNSLSDLWWQGKVVLANDKRNADNHRKVDPLYEATEKRLTGWVAVCDGEECGVAVERFNEEEVYLSHMASDEGSSKERGKGKGRTGVKPLHDDSTWEALAAHVAAVQQRANSRLGHPLETDEDLAPGSLVQRCLFPLDHLVFATYADRDRYAKALAKAAAALQPVDDKGNGKPHAVQQAVAALVAEAGVADRDIMTHILSSDAYVELDESRAKVLRVRPALLQHGGAVPEEETVVRLKEEAAVARPRRNTAVVLHGKYCDQCGRKTDLYPCVNRSADRGYYCVECWKQYEK